MKYEIKPIIDPDFLGLEEVTKMKGLLSASFSDHEISRLQFDIPEPKPKSAFCNTSAPSIYTKKKSNKLF